MPRPVFPMNLPINHGDLDNITYCSLFRKPTCYEGLYGVLCARRTQNGGNYVDLLSILSRFGVYSFHNRIFIVFL